jgi:tetratricopeptide (TPR) repeat protein
MFVLLLGLACALPVAVANDSIHPLLQTAESLYRQEGPEAALPEFERLAVEFQEKGMRLDEAIALHFIGECHLRIGNMGPAREYLDKALQIKRELGDRRQEAKSLNALGLLEWDLGNYSQASEKFREAGAVGRQLGDKKLEGATLNNLSLVYDELGDYQTSLRQYEQVLDLYANADFPRGQGDTLSNIGRVYMLLGSYRKALEHFEQALAIDERLESKPALSQDYGNMALCYAGLGEIDKALSHFERAIALAEESGMRYEHAYWLGREGNALVQKGRYDRALDRYRTMLTIYEREDARGLLLEGLHDMGQLHMLLGDPASAEHYFLQSMRHAREIGRAHNIVVNLVALGDLELRRGRLDEAEGFFDQAAAKAEEMGNQPYLAMSHLRLATIGLEREALGKARDWSVAALELAESLSARALQAEALYLLAETERLEARPAEALEGFAAAEAAIAEIGDPELLWQIYFSRAMALEATDKRMEAVDALTAAVRIIEAVRNRLDEQRFRTGYLQDKYQVYVELVRLQLDLNMTAEAFATAERLRARSFAAQLERGGWPEFSSDDQRLPRNVVRRRSRPFPQSSSRRGVTTRHFSTIGTGPA